MLMQSFLRNHSANKMYGGGERRGFIKQSEANDTNMLKRIEQSISVSSCISNILSETKVYRLFIINVINTNNARI